MSRTRIVRGALLATTATIVACQADTHVFTPSPVNPLFLSYVSIGNSITAGYQSGGINDSTQRQSYAFLLARQMGTRFAYPSLVMPGCPPPISNVLTQARVASGTSSTCALRAPGSVGATLNNVAVPGAATIDPTIVNPTTVPGNNSNTLTELFLGGKSMVQKALDAQPTFITIWMGNNDILAPALGGLPGTATTLPTFVANYSKMIGQLTAGAPGVKGVLIGVVQVAQAPILFQAGALAAALSTPAGAAAAAAVAGRPVVLDPLTCSGANLGVLINFQYIAAIAARPAALPGTVYCAKVAGGGAADPGDNGILDLAEQASVSALITGYNTYIKAKADSIGFAFYDPNITLGALKANGSIPPFPNLASTTQPFGQYFSLDGVHPSATAHITLANDLIAVINTKYSAGLAPISP